MKIKKSLIIYCIKAETYDDFLRRFEILVKYIKRCYDKELIKAMFQNFVIVRFNDILNGGNTK